MLIREFRQSDAAGTAALLDAAFGGPSEARLVAALREGGAMHHEVVAVAPDGTIAAHAALSRMAAPSCALALAPVAVLPALQRQGLGTRVVTTALETMPRDGVTAVFVLGDARYYARFGFTADAAARFRHPYPPEAMMALGIGGADLAALSDTLVYPDAFSTVE